MKDTSEVLTAIDKGTRARTTGSTSANETSSRSHSIFQISLVTGARQAGAGSSNGCSRKLSLIDLAGASVSVQSVSLHTATRCFPYSQGCVTTVSTHTCTTPERKHWMRADLTQDPAFPDNQPSWRTWVERA